MIEDKEEHKDSSLKLRKADRFFLYPPSSGIAPMLGPLERYMTPTLDTALLYSSRMGSDLGRTLSIYHKQP